MSKWEIEITEWESEPYRLEGDELWQVLAYIVPIPPDEVSHIEIHSNVLPETA
jgi:hypothetical protein